MHMDRFKKAEKLVERMEFADKIQEAFRSYPNHTRIIISNPGCSISIEQSELGGALLEGFQKVVKTYSEQAFTEFAEL